MMIIDDDDDDESRRRPGESAELKEIGAATRPE